MHDMVERAKETGKEIAGMVVAGAMGKLTQDSRVFLQSMGLVKEGPAQASREPASRSRKKEHEKPPRAPAPEPDDSIDMTKGDDGVWR